MEEKIEQISEKNEEVAEPCENLSDEQKSQNARFAAIRRRAQKQRDMAIEAERDKYESQKENDIKDALIKYEIEKNGAPKDLAKETVEKYMSGGAAAFDIPAEGKTDDENEKAAKDGFGAPARDLASDMQIANEIVMIGKYDKNIKTMRDLPKMQNFDKFCDLVKRGNSFIDAYRIANFDAISRSVLEDNAFAERQKALGKLHMQKLEGRGDILCGVPKDILDKYKSLMPGVSYGEIQRHYSDYNRK